MTVTNNLLHSPAEVARQLLADLGLATVPAVPQAANWPAYVGFEPDGEGVPDDVVTVYDTQGSSFGRWAGDGRLHGNPGVQFRVRASDHRTGWRKADAIQTTITEDSTLLRTQGRLVTLTDDDGTATTYAVFGFTQIGDVLRIGQEPGGRRALFTLNALIVMSEFPIPG